MKTIIEMAREAGFNVKNFKPPVITAQHSNGSWVSVGDELQTFATIVKAARDAELVAGVEMPEPFPAGYIAKSEYFHTDKTLRSTVAAAVLREREQCAKVCEALSVKTLAAQSGTGDFNDSVNLNIRMTALRLPEAAAAIRNRSKA